MAGEGKKIYDREGCAECHGEDLTGTSSAPSLIGVGDKYDRIKMEAVLKEPTQAMTDGGMMPVDVKPEELQVLITFLQALK